MDLFASVESGVTYIDHRNVGQNDGAKGGTTTDLPRKLHENGKQICTCAGTLLAIIGKCRTASFCIHASESPIIIMNQLKFIYNSPFKDSYSQPIHTCFSIVSSNATDISRPKAKIQGIRGLLGISRHRASGIDLRHFLLRAYVYSSSDNKGFTKKQQNSQPLE